MNKGITITLTVLSLMAIILAGCGGGPEKADKKAGMEDEKTEMEKKLDKYVEVKLTSDISHLSDNEKEMIRLLFSAADLADKIFWLQNVGPKEEVLAKAEDEKVKEFIKINYGYWDVLENLEPFVEGVGPKPKGAEFYPPDMTVEEFEAFQDPHKTSLYTLIRRDEDGSLKTVWYHEAYKEYVTELSELLWKASKLAGDREFAKYLELRAEAVKTDDYFASDMAWLDVRDNNVDLVIGPIENYTDHLFGYKAAYECFILIKDREWSDRLSKYADFLPRLQKDLPVDDIYKQETPGSDADLNAYDAIYYAGDCNMGSKTIAINLPNDEKVQLQKGTRKLQLKNAMKAKFDQILVPIADELIDESQIDHITFDAFFANTMFHEVAHGMGIKNTVSGKGTVRKALKEQYSPIEESKADILGLYLVTRLHEMGELGESDLMDNYATFMAGIFRSVRFGASSAHGKANMIRFNFFEEQGAFTKNEEGRYRVDFEKMKQASEELTRIIIGIQGEGDYDAARKLVEGKGVIKAELQEDLDKLSQAGIPVDIVFDQGPENVGL